MPTSCTHQNYTSIPKCPFAMISLNSIMEKSNYSIGPVNQQSLVLIPGKEIVTLIVNTSI